MTSFIPRRPLDIGLRVSFTAVPVAFAIAIAGAAGNAVAADGAPEKVSVSATAHFDFDRATLAPGDQNRILAEVSKMKGVTWQSVTATGHTDSVGDPAYNDRLSARRAQVVKAYLTGKGLDSQMIKTQAEGEGEPVASNESDDGRAKNRRTEVRFEGIRAASPPPPKAPS